MRNTLTPDQLKKEDGISFALADSMTYDSPTSTLQTIAITETNVKLVRLGLTFKYDKTKGENRTAFDEKVAIIKGVVGAPDKIQNIQIAMGSRIANGGGSETSFLPGTITEDPVLKQITINFGTNTSLQQIILQE